MKKRREEEIAADIVEYGKARELKHPSYELFMLLLSFLSIINIVILNLPGVDEIVKEVIEYTDIIVVVFFFVDFLYRFLTVDSKRDYFFRYWGWADLLAGMPVRVFRIFRAFRAVRVIRLMRNHGVRRLWAEIRADKPLTALFLVIFMVIIVIEFGGMGIVYAEAWHPDANIKTGGDGAWWSFVSITTVGYGDRYPVTPVGRIIGLVVLTVGVSTYGVLSGFLANAFFPTGRDASEERIPADNTDEITDLRALLEEQAKLNQALRKQLDQLERSNEDEAG